MKHPYHFTTRDTHRDQWLAEIADLRSHEARDNARRYRSERPGVTIWRMN